MPDYKSTDFESFAENPTNLSNKPISSVLPTEIFRWSNNSSNRRFRARTLSRSNLPSLRAYPSSWNCKVTRYIAAGRNESCVFSVLHECYLFAPRAFLGCTSNRFARIDRPLIPHKFRARMFPARIVPTIRSRNSLESFVSAALRIFTHVRYHAILENGFFEQSYSGHIANFVIALLIPLSVFLLRVSRATSLHHENRKGIFSFRHVSKTVSSRTEGKRWLSREKSYFQRQLLHTEKYTYRIQINVTCVSSICIRKSAINSS